MAGTTGSIARRIRERLLGISAYQRGDGYGPSLDDAQVEELREALGGNLSQQPVTRIRWYLRDLESAAYAADSGDLSQAARLYRSMRRDGVISGLLGTLTSGVVALPKKFYGEFGIDALKARNGTRSVFDDMFPPSERALLAADGEVLGVGVAEMVPVEGRDFPVMVRLEPEFLRYRWIENRWYYLSVAGMLPITPGDGRWILHTRGGRIGPWMSAKWPALGRSFINKEHALLHRSNYSAKLANPARVAEAPAAATENQRKSWLQKVMAWGINTVFETPPGYTVKLLESNGKGFDVFQAEIDTSNQEIMITLIGSTVMVDGGAGFQNGDLFRAVKIDIIRDIASSLDYTLNTQALPKFIADNYGEDAIERGACVESDVARPRDLVAEAQSMTQAAAAITSLREMLANEGRELDVDELTTRFGIPIKGDRDGDGVPDVATEDAGEDLATSARDKTRSHLRLIAKEPTWRRRAA